MTLAPEATTEVTQEEVDRKLRFRADVEREQKLGSSPTPAAAPTESSLCNGWKLRAGLEEHARKKMLLLELSSVRRDAKENMPLARKLLRQKRVVSLIQARLQRLLPVLESKERRKTRHLDTSDNEGEAGGVLGIS